MVRRFSTLFVLALALFAAPLPSSAQPGATTLLGGQVELLPLAARTATTGTGWYLNTASSAILILRVTAIAATPSIQLGLRVWDPTTGAEVVTQVLDLAAAVTTAGSFKYVFQRGGCSDSSISKCWTVPLPQGPFQLFLFHADADSITYSLQYYGGN